MWNTSAAGSLCTTIIIFQLSLAITLNSSISTTTSSYSVLMSLRIMPMETSETRINAKLPTEATFTRLPIVKLVVYGL